MRAFFVFLLTVGLTINANALTLNLKNTDIRAFIETISKATNKNFIVSPEVKGTVNVVSQTEMDSRALYALFLSILEVQGYIVVEGDGFAKILPDKETKEASSQLSLANTDQIVTTTVAVNYVKASQMVPVLRPIMSQHAHLASYDPSNHLIVTDTAANISRLRSIVLQLDRAVDTQFEILPLKNAPADEVAKILKQLVPQEAENAVNPLTIATDTRNNQLILTGAPNLRLQIRLIALEMDKHQDEEGNTHIVYLRYADAVSIQPMLQNIAQLRVIEQSNESAEPGQSKPAARTQISIQADEATNAIVITGPNDVIQTVKAVIEKLDIRRAQVLIEAIIAEVSASDAQELGVQWVGKSSAGLGIINFNNAASNIAGIAAGLVNNDEELGRASVGNGATIVTGALDSSDNGIGLVLNALASVGDANILSTPSIVTLDNEEASILVGQEVPFITNTELTSSASNPFQNFERKDVGLRLKVKPQINEGDTIKLEIEQEISNVVPTATAADLVTSKREIQTSVMVENNKILVLGGLMDDTWRDTESKVPLLGDLPVFGRAFRYSSKEKEKRNLMIFIRPTILTDQSIADSVSAQKYRYIQAAELWKKSSESRTLTTVSASKKEENGTVQIEIPEWMNYGL